MKRIDKLTKEQEAQFPEFIKKWTDIGLCTQPAARLKAEHGIRLAYAAANLKAPLKIVWTTSPLAQGLTRCIVNQMKDKTDKGVRASVRASVWDSVGDSVGAHVGASVGASVWDSVRASVWDSGYGQHDASWIAFYDFFRRVLLLEKQTDKLAGLAEITESAGWYLPHQHICLISERHRRLCRNYRGQLHSHDGMALQYPDGWGIWAWNGVRVNEQIILKPETLMPEQIAKEQNAQVRQVMVERIGIERVCRMFKAKVIDEKDTYQLLALDLGDGRIRPYLKMINPSIGCYHIEGVHPNCKTVQQAINWRSGDEKVNWQPDVLT